MNSEPVSTPLEIPEIPEVLHCANHPTVETQLRCNRCGKPICPKCAVSTPTGYRCKECIRAQQKVFQSALPRDYPIAFVIAFVLGLLGNFLVGFLGIWGLLLAFVVGFVIAESVRKATGRRRSKALFWTTAIAAGLGGLPYLVVALLAAFSGSRGVYFLLIQIAYMALVTTSAYQRLKGIVL